MPTTSPRGVQAGTGIERTRLPSWDTELLGCPNPHCARQGAASSSALTSRVLGVTRRDWGPALPELQAALAGGGTMQEGTGRCGSCPLPAAFSKSSLNTASSILPGEHTLLVAYTCLFWHWGAVGACSQRCAWFCVCVRAMAAPAASPHNSAKATHAQACSHRQPAHLWLLCLWAAES